MCFADLYLEIFLADFAVFRVFFGISRDFAEIPEFRGSATARIIRSPVILILMHNMPYEFVLYTSIYVYCILHLQCLYFHMRNICFLMIT